jgi:hypothetical protein
MINLVTLQVLDTPTFEEGVKFLKTQYRENKDRFEKNFLEPTRQWLYMNEINDVEGIVNLYSEQFDIMTPYTYQEAFKISNSTFRAKVFSIINVPEMVQNMGATRIKTSGIELKNKIYNKYTGSFEYDDMTQIYELYEISGESIGLENKLYAIKCWCTSTNTEHWIWLDKYYEDPLEGIASTCKVYKPMIGNIKHIIRQGDVFLFEMEKPVKIKETDEIVPLTKDVYFKLLKSQS